MNRKILKRIFALLTIAFSFVSLLFINNFIRIDHSRISKTNFKSRIIERATLPSTYTFRTTKDGYFMGAIGWYDNFVLYPGTYYAIAKEYVNGSFDGIWKEKHDCVVKFEQAFIDSCGWGPDLTEANSKTYMLVTPTRNIDSRDYENLMGDYIAVYELSIGDMMKPSINGTTNFIVNVNNMITQEEILKHIKATDETDGTVPVIIESSTYNPSNKKVGDYEMVVSASDKAGNKTTVTIKIKVVDIDKPVINGTKTYTRSYNNPISIDDIKAGLSISDNYDSGLQLQLIQDNYSANTNKVGIHTVTFKAVDSSDNESDVFTVSITVEDKDKPIIAGPTSISVPSNKPLSKEEFKQKFTINDGLDGAITLTDGMISGYEDYLHYYKKIGEYPVTINVSDKNGNTATLSITIKVEDKISPEIWFDDYFIILDQGQELTPQQIKEYASKVLGISVEEIVEVSGEYDTTKVENYKLSIKTRDGKTHSFNINVTEKLFEDLRSLKWFEYIYKWFSILFNIETEYQTESFWDFKTRWQSVIKVYSTKQILIKNK